MDGIELFKAFASLTLDRSQYNKDVKEADGQGKTLAENLGKYMEKAKKILGALGISLGIKKIAGDIWGLAKATSAAGDRIDKQSQALGLSRRAYQEWDYILSQNGASIDSMAMSMRTLNEQMLNGSEETEEALNGIGLTTEQLQTLAPEDQLKRIVAAMQTMPAGAEKSALAIKLFGRNAQSLMPLLNQASGSVEDLAKRAQDLGLIMSDEDVDASVAFGDVLDDLNKTWTAIQQKFGAKMLPTFTKGIIAAANALGRISNAVASAFETGKWSGVFSQITEEIGNLLPGLVETITDILIGLFDNADKIVDLAVSLVEGLTDGLVKAMPKLVAKLPAILRSVLQGALNIVGSLANGAIDLINGIFGTNIPHIDKIELPPPDQWGQIISDWWDGGNGAKTLIQDACTWVLKLFNLPEEETKVVADYVGDWFDGMVTAIQDACSWVLGLFGFPTDVDKDKLKKDAGIWFGTISGAIIDGCSWLLGLFGFPVVNKDDLKKDAGEWFDGFVDTIVAACSWVLGLFGFPSDVNGEKLSETAADWFGGIVGFIVDGCNWILGLFGFPSVNKDGLKETAKDWFKDYSGILTAACEWVLGLFGLPSNVDTEDLFIKVTRWWDKIKDTVIGACSWILQVFGIPKEDATEAANIVFGWWTGVVAAVEDACHWVLSVFGFASDENYTSAFAKWWYGEDGKSGIRASIIKGANWLLGAMGLPSVEEIEKQIAKWWYGEDGKSGIYGDLKKGINWLLGALGLPNIEEVVKQITDWWEKQVLPNLKLFFTAKFTLGEYSERLKEFSESEQAQQGGNVFANYGEWLSENEPDAISGATFNGGFAKGLNYVPYDNFLARLHRGEMVLNQNQARQYRQQETQTSTSAAIYIDKYNQYSSDDAEDLLQQMEAMQRRTAAGFGF